MKNKALLFCLRKTVVFCLQQIRSFCQWILHEKEQILEPSVPFKGKTYKEWQRSFVLFSLEKAEGSPHCSLQLPQGGSRQGGADLLSLVTSDKTWGNGMKLYEGKFRLVIRKRFLTERMLSRWNWVSREVAMAPSFLEFWERLGNALSHTVYF